MGARIGSGVAGDKLSRSMMGHARWWLQVVHLWVVCGGGMWMPMWWWRMGAVSGGNDMVSGDTDRAVLIRVRIRVRVRVKYVFRHARVRVRVRVRLRRNLRV